MSVPAVLHVSTAREWRGGQTQLLHLVRSWPGRSVVALPPDAALFPVLGSHARPIAFRGRWWGGLALRALLEREHHDLVAVHDAHALAHTDGLGVPVVVHRRVDFRPSRLGAARMRRAAGVIAVSHAVARILDGAGVRSRVVHDGVEPLVGVGDRVVLRARVGAPRDAPLLVAVGALVPHKDHATLLEALACLPGVHLAILGEGPLRARLQDLAARRGIAARLHLVGQQQDVGHWLRSADVVVHPSREEGLGQAVIEAVAAGACTVTTDAGGLPEIPGVAHRVPAGRSDLLAAALRLAMADPERGRRAARGAWTALAHGFSVEAMRDGTREAYAVFLGDGRQVTR
ncbi:MAG: glycosyltransferase [Myxococcales bacterium]|nr:glycosyltransferase [Myxococcales bacterium]